MNMYGERYEALFELIQGKKENQERSNSPTKTRATMHKGR
jgi:hypothetical protein